MTLACIYEGTSVFYHGRFIQFSKRFVFRCPVLLDRFDPESQCEYWSHATTEDGAFTLAYGHAVNAGHAVFLADLCSDRVDEAFVEMVRSVARKVAAP